MSSTSPTSPLGADSPPGGVPLLEVDAGGDPAAWAGAHRNDVRSALGEHGAVHLRGLGLREPAGLGAVAARLATELTTEQEAFAPRDARADGVSSATPWPPNQQMCMHHELSYRLEFPGVMFFACIDAPTSGGAIGIADSHAVLEALPADLVDRFVGEGWMLTRSYTDEIGLSVEEAFGTEDRRSVEDYCRANSIEFEWQSDGGLRTRQRRSAVVDHPVTGRPCWFNQIAFLSEWTMKPEVHEFLVDMYGQDGLPFNTRFGNGDPIGDDVVTAINDVYDANTTHVHPEAGDLLIVDNIRCAHSREPYDGPREVVVALADPVRLADVSPTIDVTAG